MTVLTAGGAAKRPAETKDSSLPDKMAQLSNKSPAQEANHNPGENAVVHFSGVLEYEAPESQGRNDQDAYSERRPYSDDAQSTREEGGGKDPLDFQLAQIPTNIEKTTHLSSTPTQTNNDRQGLIWLLICFLGIMASFVCYGLLLEYATSGGNKLHELSFLFVTSGLYTLTAAAGRYVRDETPTTIPPARFAVLGLTSMGSTFFSVRSLRYVIYPIQVLAKSCKPVPVMLMGTLMGKSYPLKKYINVVMIVLGVALFMGGGSSHKKGTDEDSDGDHEAEGDDETTSPSQLIGIVMLFISLCFDGGTGAYEDKLMSVHSVQPFDLMYNIQLGKTILAGVGLLVLNELHEFIKMIQDKGFLLIGLGLSGALGQVFIFVTIAKFGALTCSIIGLARKVTTLCASIYFYGHHLNGIQGIGLFISISAMVLNFWGKKTKGGGGGHESDSQGKSAIPPEEMEKMLSDEEAEVEIVPLEKSSNNK